MECINSSRFGHSNWWCTDWPFSIPIKRLPNSFHLIWLSKICFVFNVDDNDIIKYDSNADQQFRSSYLRPFDWWWFDRIKCCYLLSQLMMGEGEQRLRLIIVNKWTRKSVNGNRCAIIFLVLEFMKSNYFIFHAHHPRTEKSPLLLVLCSRRFCDSI